VIRLGGNTQEFATLVPELPDGHTFGKEESGSNQTVHCCDAHVHSLAKTDRHCLDQNPRGLVHHGHVLHDEQCLFNAEREMVPWYVPHTLHASRFPN
jgi:hypothetical protein